jgi:adenylate cyclase
LIGTIRRGARWLNERRTLGMTVRAWREVLPGDPRFGDPLSTTGTEPAQILARRAYSLYGSRWSLAGQFALAALQVADWLAEDIGSGGERHGEVAIVFTDLVGFSTWALEAGDAESLELLRRVDAEVAAAVEENGGELVKRMGDGMMAVFPDAPDALDAARDALRAAPDHAVDGYVPKLRVGMHFGTPRSIGDDYIGIDVNIAARLCEAAEADEVLLSEVVRSRLGGDGEAAEKRPRSELPGVPDRLTTYRVTVNGNGR